jgi:hypothetical protein
MFFENIYFKYHHVSIACFLFASYNNIYSQNLNITGKIILDTANGVSVSYAIIKHKNNFVYSDSAGNFLLQKVMLGDSILVSCVSIESKHFIIQNTEDVYIVNKKAYLLNEVKIAPKETNSKVVYSNTNKKTSGFTSEIGVFYASLVKFETAKENLTITELHIFFRTKKSKPNIRLHIYKNNNNKPGEEILIENAVVTIKKNIAKYKLNTPINLNSNAFFIAIEWLDKTEKDNSFVSVVPVSRKFPSYFKLNPHDEWHLFSNDFNKQKDNLMLKLEVYGY